MKLVATLLAALLAQSSYATSTAAPHSDEEAARRARSKLEPYCRVSGRFQSVLAEPFFDHRGQLVRNQYRLEWLFSVSQTVSVYKGSCPQDSELRLSVREGRMHRLENGEEIYRYPDHISVPQPNTEVELEVIYINERKEWLVRDWTDGFRRKID